MANSIRYLIFAGAIFATTTCADADPPVSRDKPSPATTPASQTEPASRDAAIVLTDAENQAVEAFGTRVHDYMALRGKLVAQLPALPEKDATPEQSAEHRRALSALIQNERKDAKQGQFFTPAMVSLVRRALEATIDGAGGATTEASITDDTPAQLFVNVNDRYPEGASVSSMPMELLTTLPAPGEALEYRFIGKQLVLLDVPAQIILDITPGILP